MTSELKVDKITPASGTSGTIGDSGDTFTVPSGATLTASAATVNLPTSIITGVSEKTTLVDADKFLISDSAASGAFKHVQKSNLPSGTHVKLLAGSASSAVNHDLVGFISSTYHCYLVLLSKVIGLQGNTLDFQFADGGGPFTASNYWDAAHGFRSNGSDRFTQGGENQAQARLGSGLDASSTRSGSYFFYIYVNPNSTAFSCSASGQNWGYRADYGDYIHADFTLGMDNTNTVTGFRLHAQGNDATTFDYQIYGIAK
jgi:hypothetical protein